MTRPQRSTPPLPRAFDPAALRMLRDELGERRFRAFVSAAVERLAQQASPADRAKTVDTILRRVARLRL